ncbi:hypothetical protein [uncultured Helicobacter sp.]|uniref:hypothetical protein n=1 Tax=uncultured Helicobacter sp. TaxID=175537 RepID=UPI001C39C222|nr:hypothetical protein [Candidatus Helicobacter avicola]
MRYKLVMFGFSALCMDLEEVSARLKGYPPERAQCEGGDQCYLIDLHSGKSYEIALDSQNHYTILNLTTQT